MSDKASTAAYKKLQGYLPGIRSRNGKLPSLFILPTIILVILRKAQPLIIQRPTSASWDAQFEMKQTSWHY